VFIRALFFSQWPIIFSHAKILLSPSESPCTGNITAIANSLICSIKASDFMTPQGPLLYLQKPSASKWTESLATSHTVTHTYPTIWSNLISRFMPRSFKMMSRPSSNTSLSSSFHTPCYMSCLTYSDCWRTQITELLIMQFSTVSRFRSFMTMFQTHNKKKLTILYASSVNHSFVWSV
jgi:hypothetical protein